MQRNLEIVFSLICGFRIPGFRLLVKIHYMQTSLYFTSMLYLLVPDFRFSDCAYHLHRKHGNSGWKMKCYIPFNLESFRNYRLSA